MSLKDMDEKVNGKSEEKLIFTPVASKDAPGSLKDMGEKINGKSEEKPIFTPVASKNTPKPFVTESKTIDYLSAIEGDEAARGKK